MSFGRVRCDENGNLVISVPAEIASKSGLKEGDHVQIQADEATGQLTITRAPIKPRARYDFHEVVRHVISEERELLDRLAEYDRSEEP